MADFLVSSRMMTSLRRHKRPCLTALLTVLLLLPGCGGTDLVRQEADTPAPDQETGTVLLISLDGFRWDYLDKYDAPHLEELAEEGVRAEHLIPAFPTKTFPNHYTLVTGLYPEHHGIVANNMYDPVFDASFSLGDRNAVADARWWEGEPLWVTAEKQGQKAATYFWPGSEAAIEGVRPSYWKPYDGRVPGPDRVAEVLEWLDLPPAERPTFLTLYFSTVDSRGHDSGPDSEAVEDAVEEVDGYLGMLIEGLEERELLDEINLIVTADHGMIATSSERVVILDDYIDLEEVQVVDWSPVLMLRPDEGKEEAVYQQLKQAPHLSVYRKAEIPERLHFQAHRRIPAVIGIADEGWSIATRERYEQNPARFNGGTHGYDNQLVSMGAVFVARGPAFKEGLVVGPFENIHLYNLMAAILGLDPAPNDGSLEAVRHLLDPQVLSSR